MSSLSRWRCILFPVILILGPGIADSSSSNFQTVKYPGGISISLPRSWIGLPADVQTQADTIAEAIVDLSGMEIDLKGYNTLFSLVQPLENHFASIKISVTFGKGEYLTQKQQKATSDKELRVLDKESHDVWTRMSRNTDIKLVIWHPMSIQAINGSSFYVSKAVIDSRMPTGPVYQEQYQMHDRDRLITVTASYAHSEKRLWEPVCKRTLHSLTIKSSD